MLVLTRKKDQSIIIGDIEITVLDIKGDQIRLGIDAPKDVTILRKEVFLAVKEENKAALMTNEIDLHSITQIMKKI